MCYKFANFKDFHTENVRISKIRAPDGSKTLTP